MKPTFDSVSLPRDVLEAQIENTVEKIADLEAEITREIRAGDCIPTLEDVLGWLAEKGYDWVALVAYEDGTKQVQVRGPGGNFDKLSLLSYLEAALDCLLEVAKPAAELEVE